MPWGNSSGSCTMWQVDNTNSVLVSVTTPHGCDQSRLLVQSDGDAFTQTSPPTGQGTAYCTFTRNGGTVYTVYSPEADGTGAAGNLCDNLKWNN